MLAPETTVTPAAALPAPPPIGREHALFLDVDGCLIDLAPSPGEVRVAPRLPLVLSELGEELGGAVAVISGRSLGVIDQLLAPWRACGAGVHGAEIRLPCDGQTRYRGASLRPVVERLRERFGAHPDVLVEDKGMAVAVHYARCPEMQVRCEAAVLEEIRHLPDLRLQRGRAVIEALPQESDKGTALSALMRCEPFAGRIPVFAGDDRTDEAALAVLRDHPQAVGVKVGPGATAARYRLDSPTEVRGWLEASLRALRGRA